MNTIRNKGCFPSLSCVVVIFKLLDLFSSVICFVHPSSRYSCSEASLLKEKNGGGFNIVIVILSVFWTEDEIAFDLQIFQTELG